MFSSEARRNAETQNVELARDSVASMVDDVIFDSSLVFVVCAC
jgi:hypothetical protein